MQGMTEWKPVFELLGGFEAPQAPKVSYSLPKLQGFSIIRFFSEVFKRHDSSEIDELFSGGSPRTTPDLMSIDTSWPTPWVFARMLLMCILLMFGFGWAALEFKLPAFQSGFLLMAIVAVPFCMLVLFMELNVRRDVSAYGLIKAVIGGGLISLVLTMLFTSVVKDYQSMIWAGPIEEPAKLLAAIIIASKMRDGRILRGMLIGCAVGMGFHIFEIAQYFLIRGPEQLLLRALMTPMTHMLWTAIAAGAYWMVYDYHTREGRRLVVDQFSVFNSSGLNILGDKRFLAVAIIPILLHMFNNCSLWTQGYPEIFITRGSASIIGWIIVLRLVQKGLHQIREEQEKKQKEEGVDIQSV